MNAHRPRVRTLEYSPSRAAAAIRFPATSTSRSAFDFLELKLRHEGAFCRHVSGRGCAPPLAIDKPVCFFRMLSKQTDDGDTSHDRVQSSEPQARLVGNVREWTCGGFCCWLLLLLSSIVCRTFSFFPSPVLGGSRGSQGRTGGSRGKPGSCRDPPVGRSLCVLDFQGC